MARQDQAHEDNVDGPWLLTLAASGVTLLVIGHQR